MTLLHFSRESVEWSTPREFFLRLHAEFSFTLDPCATHANHQCDHYFTVRENGLHQIWAPERVFMNPPYGDMIGRWMKKAYIESRRGALVVCLVPARTDTAWWHDYAMKGVITFIRGRLIFGGHSNPAPFPSAVIVFYPT